MENILSKLRSVELCLSAHPYNEEHSEFADRICDLQDIQKEVKHLIEWKKEALIVMNNMDLQAIGKLLNIPLGQSVSENLLNNIKKYGKKNIEEGVIIGMKIFEEINTKIK